VGVLSIIPIYLVVCCYGIPPHFLKEHISQLRAVGAVFENLAPLGLAIDKKANRSIKGAKTGFINTETGKTKILVIPANEELMIARETYNKALKKRLKEY